MSAAAPLHAAIAALEAQRPLIGDVVVELAIAPLRAQLAALSATVPASSTTPPSADAPQRLKLVSILFLDVVGSTSLSRRFNPEDIHALTDGCLARCTELVERQGGQVPQYAGDSARQGRAVAQRHGHNGFGVRVGIHTGQVLLRGGVDADGSICGIAVNIAARMEQTAPPGHLRISRDTQRLVRGLFEMDPQPVIAVKRIDAPLENWLVRRGIAALGTVPTRGLVAAAEAAPLIGRQADLARLALRVDEVRRERRVRCRHSRRAP